MSQQTREGCAFCDAGPDVRLGQAGSWGKDELITHPICVECALREHPDPAEQHCFACDGCGCLVDAVAALTRYRVQLAHLEGTPISALAAVPPDRQPTGLATSERTSFVRSNED
ncbi:hypothetical protein J2754_003100 [Halarchaeum solikamskense]|nr:hypothetical protein [Halarchaeum solikamskense]MBP2252754.1 hypothetical protein [Halarchaeum solikamskense]